VVTSGNAARARRRIALRVLNQSERRIAALLYPSDHDRPRTRAECPDRRPCPFALCRMHLGVDVTDRGALIVVGGPGEPWELEQTCALDLAERGGMSLQAVADVMHLSRERVRQLQEDAIAKIRQRPGALAELLEQEG
jgi:hypothetical protein